jgi:hypothetical protein
METRSAKRSAKPPASCTRGRAGRSAVTNEEEAKSEVAPARAAKRSRPTIEKSKPLPSPSPPPPPPPSSAAGTMSEGTTASATPVMVVEPVPHGQPSRSRNPFLDLLDAPTSHSLQGLLRRLGGLGSIGEDLLLSESSARFGDIVRGLKPTAEPSHQLQVNRPPTHPPSHPHYSTPPNRPSARLPPTAAPDPNRACAFGASAALYKVFLCRA